jgi:ATP-dependent Lhr-like helicase
VRDRLAAGACFFTDLLIDVDLPPEEIQESLWDLVWNGMVTNDAFAPLRAPRLTLARGQRSLAAGGGASRRAGRFASRRRPGSAAQLQGRWSLTEPLFRGQADPSTRRRALAELLLERYGILTREQVLAEGIAGGFSAIYPELSQLETLGVARRGYFVEGLGGAQFALPGAVERLRGLPDEDRAPVVLSAVDPAQPYGAALSWPRSEREGSRRPARVAGAYVVLTRGDPVLYLERGGRALQTLVPAGDPRLEPALEALVVHVRSGRSRRIGLEKVDNESAMTSSLAPLLVRLGFQEGPRRLTLSA